MAKPTKKSAAAKKSAKKPVAKPVASAKKPAAKPAPKKFALPKVQLAEGVKRPHLGGLGRGLDSLFGRKMTQSVAAAPAVAAPAPAAAPAEDWTAVADKLNAAPAAAPVAAVAPAPEAAVAAAPAAPDARSVRDVAVSKIHPSPWQPRQIFEEESINELAESIKVHGIIQPLLCRRRADGDYELVGGERRLRAAGVLELKEVPVLLVDAADADAAELALVDNLQREDLNIIEEAEAYRMLGSQFGLTQQDIAERVGRARASVANVMRLLELPDEVKQLLGEGRLSTGHAKVLLSVPTDDERIELARACLGEGLTVRALESRIRRRQAGQTRIAPVADVNKEYLGTILDKLHERLGTSVRIAPSCTYANGRHGRGHIEIDYFDNEELSRLLDLFGVDMNEI